MLLKDYIPNVKNKFRKTFFSGVSFDSSKVKKDNIFFAIKGTKVDGNKYIYDSIKRGAKVIVSEKNIIFDKKNIIFIKHKNPRKLLAEISGHREEYFS